MVELIQGVTYRISEVESFDLERVLFIEQSCFGKDDAFSEEDLPAIVEESPLRVGAFADNVLVGYALARHAFGIGYLYSNAVLKEYRGLGLGTRLVRSRTEKLWSIGCFRIQAHTKPNNEASAKVLRNCGLSPVQYVTDFYEDNADAILWST